MAERGPLAAVRLTVDPYLDEDANSPVLTPKEIKRGVSHYWDRMRARQKAEKAAGEAAGEARAVKVLDEILASPFEDEDDLSFIDHI